MNYPPSIVQINISRGGIPKRAVSECLITPFGIEGDSCAHPQIHGGLRQAVLLIGSETIEELVARGYPVYSGALGENLTTHGLDRLQLRVGHRIRVGPVLLELTRVRVPCSALDVYGPAIKQEIYDKRVAAGDPGSPRWGMSGFYAAVIEPGPVRINDIISLEAVLA